LKTRHTVTNILISFCSICLFACDDSDEIDNGGTSGPILSVTNAAELDSLFLQIADLQCNAPCELIPQLREAGDVCRDLIVFELRDDRADYLNALENDRIEFNTDFYQCIYTVLTSENACDESARDRCEGDLFTGKVLEGSECSRDRECQDSEAGLGYCRFPDEVDDFACNVGTCALEEEIRDVTVMEGEPCGSQSEEVYCARDLVCDYDAEIPVCVRTQVVTEGETCDYLTKLCEGGLFCSPQDDNVTYTCQPLGALNDTCSRSKPCNIPFYCDLQSRDMPGTCKARIADGQACTPINSIDTEDNSCNYGSMCIDQICRPIRFEGESCELSSQCQGRGDQYTCQNNICSKVCE
jgi:hypothetical protein